MPTLLRHVVSNTSHGALTACNVSASGFDWTDVPFGKMPADLTLKAEEATCAACRVVIDHACRRCHAGPGTRCSQDLGPVAPHEERLAAPADLGTCLWYARCANPAVGTVAHPILGPVPTCRRCADKHELELL